MDAIQLLMLSVGLYGVGALATLLFNHDERKARYSAGITGLVASLLGAASAAWALLAGLPLTLELPGAIPFGRFIIEMDSLSAFLVVVITLLGAATSLYSISYTESYPGRSLGVLGFFNNLFMATMILVVVIANAFYFLLFWEMMTLCSYFLVIFEQEKRENVFAGYLYLLVAHAGTALIMLAFFGLYMNSGSFDFAAFRQAGLSPAAKNLVFLLAFFGFGAKAGIIPLHIWLPRAHPAAPSHVSALLSGVMIKTAIYGIIRVNVDFLGAPSWWWGLVVLAFGGLSALLGVLYALSEKELKRLLAYSSVENIGIILMGVGAGMIGIAVEHPVMATLGFMAALYHLANHAFFKGLLFLGAGSVIYRVHTRDMNAMGGLARRMPWTALTFLVGALAVSAIPPLNGFVSEWFTYQTFFVGSSSQVFVVKFFSPLFAVLLSLTGALAVMCFIKAYSGTFTGPARSQPASEAREAPAAMISSMAFLALVCLALGLASPLVAPMIAGVVTNLLNADPVQVASGLQVFPGTASGAVLSTPLMALLLVGLLAAPLLVILLFRGARAGRRSDVEPWTCGYGYSYRMAVSASNFDQPVRFTFQPLYQIRIMVERPLSATAKFLKLMESRITQTEPVLEKLVSQPVTRAVGYLGTRIQALQMGDIRVYCLYIVLTLAILLIVAVR